jgi:hypothetical protein
MTSSTSRIERIAIMTRLVLQYSPGINLVRATRLAKNLADALDELRLSGVDARDLTMELTHPLPEHWKKRTELLRRAIFQASLLES